MKHDPAHDEGLELEPDSALNDPPPPVPDPAPPPLARPRLRVVSVPSAIAGAILVATIALGTAGLRPGAGDSSTGGDDGVVPVAQTYETADGGHDRDEPTGDDPADEPGPDETDDSSVDETPDIDAEEAGDREDAGATPKPEAEPTPKPTPEPTPKPTPKPEPEALDLTLSRVEGKIKVDWTTCKADAFGYYKVVRSPDSMVSWPAGENDKLIGVIESRSKTAMYDGDFPHGKKLWYRVFCVADSEHDYKKLGSSKAKSIVAPAAEQPPEPYVLGFEADVTDEGVVLNWEPCGSDGFLYYKVLRSTGENPSYLPWTEGTEVIAVIENGEVTTFTDTDVASGDHWFYRVQSIGMWNGKKVVLGETAVREVSIE